MSRRSVRSGSFALAAALVVSAGFFQAVRADEPTRTWADASDRYQIEARLIGHEGGTVRLKRADDSVVEIALDQLSEADRKYVAEYDAGNPFLRGMKPTGGTSTPRPPAPVDLPKESDSPSPTPADSEATTIDWSSVPSIDAALNGDLSSLQIAPAADGPALTERTIGLPDLRDFLEQAGTLVVDGPSGTALFSASHSQRDQGSTVLAEIDLANGTVTERLETTGAYRALAWDPTTKRALTTNAARDPRVRRMVEVWSLEADSVTKGLVVDPSDDSRPSIRGIRWGCFLPNERFALLSDRGRFSVWSLDANVPIAASSTDGYRAAAISPDRAFVALATNDSVTFLDTAQLKIVGRLKESLAGVGSVAFSPDGRWFAAETFDKFRVWSASDFSQSVERKGGRGRGAFFFADEGRIYAHDRLIDVESGRSIIEIDGSSELVAPGGGFCWLYAEDRGKRARKLVALPALPEYAVGRLEVLPPEQRQVLFAAAKPVRLDLSGIEDETARSTAQKALAEVVKKSGRSIEADAAAALVATIEKGKDQTFQYTKVERRGVGPGPPFGPLFGPRIGRFGDDIKERRELKIVPVTLKLELQSDGQTIWNQTKSQLPKQLQNLPPVSSFSVSFPIPEGKTVDDVVNDIQTPNPERFGEFELPAEILAPEVIPPPLLGSRKLTISGLE